MPLHAKQRSLRRRQRRVKKLRYLKSRLKETRDLKEKQFLMNKIRKISPWETFEEK